MAALQFVGVLNGGSRVLTEDRGSFETVPFETASLAASDVMTITIRDEFGRGDAVIGTADGIEQRGTVIGVDGGLFPTA